MEASKNRRESSQRKAAIVEHVGNVYNITEIEPSDSEDDEMDRVALTLEVEEITKDLPNVRKPMLSMRDCRRLSLP